MNIMIFLRLAIVACIACAVLAYDNKHASLAAAPSRLELLARTRPRSHP